MQNFSHFLPYWRNEQSGKLIKAVERFFAYSIGEDPMPLSDSEFMLLKGYLKFWIDYPWEGLGQELDCLRAKFDKADSYEQLQVCIDTALELCIDPF